MHSLEDDRSFSEVEENAIYFVAGYIIRKLIYSIKSAVIVNQRPLFWHHGKCLVRTVLVSTHCVHLMTM